MGIVYKTSPHYSTVIPLLNSKSSISCKIVGSEYFGYLKWEYGDSRYAYLKDLPRHAEFNLGDTVVTSGYSTVFPAGIMVGTVDDMSDSRRSLLSVEDKTGHGFRKGEQRSGDCPYRTRRAADIGEGRREMMGVISVRVFSDKQLMG